jgi:hypothetical protein
MPSIIRYSKPSRLDVAPYGTVYEVVMEPEQPPEFYVQSSKDDQAPNWISRGAFLELAFATDLRSDKFIQECLKKIK